MWICSLLHVFSETFFTLPLETNVDVLSMVKNVRRSGLWACSSLKMNCSSKVRLDLSIRCVCLRSSSNQMTNIWIVLNFSQNRISGFTSEPKSLAPDRRFYGWARNNWKMRTITDETRRDSWSTLTRRVHILKMNRNNRTLDIHLWGK